MDPLLQEQNKPTSLLGARDFIVDRIYQTAKTHLGQHLTLNNTVPADVGCAEAVSFILKNADVPTFPHNGFPGTAALFEYLKDSLNFQEKSVGQTVPGCIIISPSGTSTKGAPHGHVGILGKFGILSNDSATGLFLEFWTIEKWQKYYQTKLGFPIYYYQAVN